MFRPSRLLLPAVLTLSQPLLTAQTAPTIPPVSAARSNDQTALAAALAEATKEEGKPVLIAQATTPTTPPADAGRAGTPARPDEGAGAAPAGPGAGGPEGGTPGGRGGFGRRGGFGPGGAAPVDENTTFTIEGNQVALTFPNNAVTDLLAVYEKLTGMTMIKDTAIFDGATISLVTPKPVDKAEAVRLIEATLLINGYAIVLDPGGKSARILPTRSQGAAQLQFSQGVKFYTDAKQLPEGETLVTYFMKLEHLTPEEAGTILANHVGLNVYGRITAVTTPPGLLITESSTIVRQLISIREVIDVTETASSLITKFVKLQYADAATVAQIIQATLDAQMKDKEAKGFTTIRGQAQPERRSSNGPPGAPSAPSAPASSGSNERSSSRNGGANALPVPTSQVVADPRLNQILVVSTPEDYAYITSLIVEFDKPVEVEEPYERRLNYAFCVDVLSSLVDILKEATSTTSSQLPGGGTLNLQQQQPLTSSSAQLLSGRNTTNARGARLAGSTGATTSSDGGTGGTTGGGSSGKADSLLPPTEDNAPISVLVNKTRVIADPPSNSIFVMGPKEAVDKVKGLLDKLDKKPSQVYLATIIGQLTLGDGFDFGIDWLNQFNRTGGGSGFSSSFINKRSDIITNNNITDLRDNLITTAFGPASGFNVYGQITESVQAYVTALETTNKFKVLSRPSVFALNNKKATITSGQSIPVPSQSTTNLNNNGNTITTTVAYKDVVLKLEVVPLINPNDEVTLTIAQINDTVVGTQRVEPNDVPIISTEQVITTVTVPSGNTVVLGGLISETDKKNTGAVPLVGRIPLLGNLFKNNSKSTSRNELVIFIQPHVVNDDLGMQKASRNEDIRSSVGADAAQLFPTEPVAKEPTVGIPEPRKSWIKRLFATDLEKARPNQRVISPLPRHP